MKATLFYLLLISTTLTGCTWFENLKPKETFYCKVNGEKFRPEKDNSPIGGIGSDPLRVQFNKDTGVLFISVRDSPREISFIILTGQTTLKPSEHILTNEIPKTKAYFTPDNSADKVPEDIISNSGKFIINKIDGYNISGTFEFTCKSAKTGKEYKITEGEFNDISYY